MYYKNIGMWPKTTSTRLMWPSKRLDTPAKIFFIKIWQMLTTAFSTFNLCLCTKVIKSTISTKVSTYFVFLICTLQHCARFMFVEEFILYACLGENYGELSFEPNQIITNGTSNFLCLNSIICWIISLNFAH